MLLSDTSTVTEVVVAEVMIAEVVGVEGATTVAQIMVMVEIMVALVVTSPTNNNPTSLVDRLRVMGAIAKVVDHRPTMAGKVMGHLGVVHQAEADLQTPNTTLMALEEVMAHQMVLTAGTMEVMVDKEMVRVEEATVDKVMVVEEDMEDTADKQQTAMEGTVEAVRIIIIHEVEEGEAGIEPSL